LKSNRIKFETKWIKEIAAMQRIELESSNEEQIELDSNLMKELQ
jgi:hypothetical protein